MDIATVATTAEKVVEGVAKVEPIVLPIAGMFVPGLSAASAVFQPYMPAIFQGVEDALNAIAAKNGGDFLAAAITLMQHMKPGMPNSPILSGPAG